MAKQTTVTITSDLDGAENAKTRTFYDFAGLERTIDLTDEQWDVMRDAMQVYIDKSEKAWTAPTSAPQRRPYGTGPVRKHKDTKKIREWLREHGRDISDFGRIPTADLDAHEEFERNGTVPDWSTKKGASKTAPAANKTTDADAIAARTEAIDVPEQKPATKKTAAKAGMTDREVRQILTAHEITIKSGITPALRKQAEELKAKETAGV